MDLWICGRTFPLDLHKGFLIYPPEMAPKGYFPPMLLGGGKQFRAVAAAAEACSPVVRCRQNRA